MNIFGKEVEEYRIFADACPNMNRLQMQDAITRGGRKVDWAFKPEFKQFADQAEALTAAYGLVSNNLQAISAESDEILRRDFQLNEFVPINQNVPEGATSKATNIVNRHGKGKFITKNGKNVERAEASVNRVAYPISYAGVMAAWSIQELRESLFSGMSLSNETLRAAIEACNDHIQEVGFVGDADEGFEGILNGSDVPIFAGPVPDWTTATGDEIVAFVQLLISTIGDASNEVFYRRFRNGDLQMNLPTVAFDILANTRYGDNADHTLGKFIKENNPWKERTGRDLVIKSLPEARDAGASGEARLSLYPKDSRVLEMDMPIAPRPVNVLPVAYGVETPYEYSMSGVNWKRGTLAMYADGILG